jgi:hypothetical protein
VRENLPAEWRCRWYSTIALFAFKALCAMALELKIPATPADRSDQTLFDRLFSHAEDRLRSRPTQVASLVTYPLTRGQFLTTAPYLRPNVAVRTTSFAFWCRCKGRFALGVKAMKSWDQFNQYLSSFEAQAGLK